MTSRKQNKKSDREDYAPMSPPQRRFQSEGINFFAMVLGMSVSFLMLLLLWNIVEEKLERAKTYNSIDQIVSTEQVGALTDDEFESLIKTRDIAHLSKVLSSLNGTTAFGSALQRFGLHQRRVESANKMLSLPLNGEQRQFAVVNKIDGLIESFELDFLHKLGQPKFIENLRKTSAKFREDQDPMIAMTAKKSLFRLAAFESTLAPGRKPNTEPVVENFESLVIEYPDEESVYAEARKIVDFFLNQYDQKTGIDFVSGLKKLRSKVNSAPATEFFNELDDSIVLAETNYQQLFENRLVQGPVGQRQLFDTSLDLASRAEGGVLILHKIDQVAQWFEEDDQRDRSTQIYQKMDESSGDHKEARIAVVAKEIARAGLIRSKLNGELFEFDGHQISGAPFDPMRFRGKVVALFFWSNRDVAAVEALHALYEDTKDWKNSKREFIAVCVDEKPDDLSVLAQELDRFLFVVRDRSTGRLPILKQCPSQIVPRAMLVDRSGKVFRSSVPIINLRTQAELLSE